MLNPIRALCGPLLLLGRVWERLEQRRALRRGMRWFRMRYYERHGKWPGRG